MGKNCSMQVSWRLGRHGSLVLVLLLAACVHAGTQHGEGADTGAIPVARGGVCEPTEGSGAERGSCRPDGAPLSPREALAAMMQEVEERVLAARRAQQRGEECLPCAAAAACCRACACVHGSCADDGACLCEADWFGDSCEFHVLKTGYFLPPFDPNERLPRRQAQAFSFSRPSARLVGEVDRLQHHHGCAEGSALVSNI